MPRTLWRRLRELHRAAKKSRRASLVVRVASGASMAVINVAISMLMMGGFASAYGAAAMTHGVLACALYGATLGLIALSIALDLSARKDRRRLFQMLLCLDNAA